MVKLRESDGKGRIQAAWHKLVPKPKYFAIVFIGGIILIGLWQTGLFSGD